MAKNLLCATLSDECSPSGKIRKGLCSKHYFRMWRSADYKPNKQAPHGAGIAFMERAIASSTDDCIEWPYGKHPDGYGRVHFEGRLEMVSRLVLARTAGPSPSEEHQAAHLPVVCHRPSCINPRHLRWATPSENALDRHLDETLCSKLTREHVAEMRERARLGALQQDLAEEYGVTAAQVSRIILGQQWR